MTWEHEARIKRGQVAEHKTDLQMFGKHEDLTGQRFGRLVVLDLIAKRSIHKKIMWRCLCDCGKEKSVATGELNSGKIRSCGCLLADRQRELKTTHGKTETRLYSIWRGMKRRCENPKSKNWKYYGALGVSVCDEWKNSFQAFYDWAMSAGYDETAPRGQCTIDRINPYGDYAPDNCRWADMKTQLQNRRKAERKRFDLQMFAA